MYIFRDRSSLYARYTVFSVSGYYRHLSVSCWGSWLSVMEWWCYSHPRGYRSLSLSAHRHSWRDTYRRSLGLSEYRLWRLFLSSVFLDRVRYSQDHYTPYHRRSRYWRYRRYWPSRRRAMWCLSVQWICVSLLSVLVIRLSSHPLWQKTTSVRSSWSLGVAPSMSHR